MTDAILATTRDQEQVGISPLSEELPNVVDWLPDGLIPTWEIVLATPFLASLVIAITFYLLAIVLRSVIFWGLGQLANMTESLLDDDVLQYLRKPAFTSVLYFGLTLATMFLRRLSRWPCIAWLNSIDARDDMRERLAPLSEVWQ